MFSMVYLFKVWFEEIEDVVRWIEIKPSHSFQHFHAIIQEAIGFDNKELASFFVSDNQWRRISEITLSKSDVDFSGIGNANAPLMSEIKLRMCVNDPHQRFIYVSDYAALWTFRCELIGIEEHNDKYAYPRVYKSHGKSPRQRDESKFNMLNDAEFDALAEKILASKGAQKLVIEPEQELFDAENTSDLEAHDGPEGADLKLFEVNNESEELQ